MDTVPVQVAFVRLIQDDTILMIQEGGSRSHGMWAFPGGHANEGETVERAAVREVHEETGYIIALGPSLAHKFLPEEEYRGQSSDVGKTIDLTIFEGVIVSGALRKGPDELDLRWFGRQEAKGLLFRWPWLIDLL